MCILIREMHVNTRIHVKLVQASANVPVHALSIDDS